MDNCFSICMIASFLSMFSSPCQNYSNISKPSWNNVVSLLVTTPTQTQPKGSELHCESIRLLWNRIWSVPHHIKTYILASMPNSSSNLASIWVGNRPWFSEWVPVILCHLRTKLLDSGIYFGNLFQNALELTRHGIPAEVLWALIWKHCQRNWVWRYAGRFSSHRRVRVRVLVRIRLLLFIINPYICQFQGVRRCILFWTDSAPYE
jgi:hypothetical protein